MNDILDMFNNVSGDLANSVSGDSTMVENYDPSQDESSKPYISSSGKQAIIDEPIPTKSLNEGFVDFDNLMSYKKETPTKNDMMSAFNNVVSAPQPTVDKTKAKENYNSMNDMLSQLQNVLSDEETSIVTKNPDMNIGQVIESLRKSSEYLKAIESWFPEAKKEYLGKLTNIAKPIIPALDSYASTLEKMK